MIWTLIVLWVLAALAFFGSLVFIASKDAPSFEGGTLDEGANLTAWEEAARESRFAGSHAAIG
jgi:hypothetical protein